MTDTIKSLEREDIQGLLFSAYAHLPFCTFLLLEVHDAREARTWLASVTQHITNASGKVADTSLNIALTYTGLEKLGLAGASLDSFAFAFKQGMTESRRASRLGDVDSNAPANWEWGKDGTIHVLLLLYASSDSELEKLHEAESIAFTRAHLTCLHAFKTTMDPAGKEHFGFKDGIGQPVIEGTNNEQRQRERTGHATVIPAGEFLLGHQNLYRLRSQGPTVESGLDPDQLLKEAKTQTGEALAGYRDFGLNGTYLVFRQLEQDVAKFWNAMGEKAHKLDFDGPDAAEKAAARCVGRWPSGAPLTLTPYHDDPSKSDANDFTYGGSDPDGLRCPIGAHIRRANPRDMKGIDPTTTLPFASLHRIIRRGRSYGPKIENRNTDDGEKRGLHFMCFNADLERQFELVQQTWLNNPSFGGLSGEVDPLVGTQSITGGRFTMQQTPVRRRVQGLESYVTVRGGSYFFVPSVRALRYLASI